MSAHPRARDNSTSLCKGEVGERSEPGGGPAAPAPLGTEPPHPLPDPPPCRGKEKKDDELRARAWAAAAKVVDPEIPVLTVVDLGVLRDITVQDGKIEVTITPTYSGCPAMDLIALNLEMAIEDAGLGLARIKTVLSPAWTTDWMSEEGKAKLKRYGVAPPIGKAGRRALFGEDAVRCPRCDSQDCERLSEFGSTACKALWRCRACAEPFDYFKCI